MPPHRRRLLVALLAAAACALGAALVLARGVDDPRRVAAGAHPLATVGEGPAGGRPVTLARWRYRADPGDVGRERGWARGGWRGRAVRVPHVPNPGPVAGPGAQEAYAGSVGWFARDVVVPEDGRYAIAFGSAHHRATVYVDGRPVRRHTGVYQPFSARPALRRGRHTIVVRVDWRDPERQAQGGWARAWFNFGGLNRPVTIARMGPAELGALTVRTRLRDDGAARVDVTVRVRRRGGPVAVPVRGVLRRGGDEVALRFGAARVPAGDSRTVRASATVDDPALWSPERPGLYDLRVEVPGAAAIERRVGLREIGWADGTLRLNGAPLTLRGAGLPPDVQGRGDAFTAADEAEIVRELQAAGANAARSQLPLSESLLARLDAAGILVWQHVGPFEPAGAWRSDTPALLELAVGRAVRTAEAAQAHPSVLAWTLTNEAAGQGRPEQVAYVRDAARALRELDPGRPVAADLWGKALPREEGPLFAPLDAIGVTDYAGWYEDIDVSGAVRAAIVRERLARVRALFPDKPLVVTEFGAAGTERIADAAFGGVDFQAGLLADRVRTLASAPGVSGMLVWSLRDFALRPDFRGGSVLDLRPGLDLAPGLNEKGLFDYDGEAKPALAAVRRAFAATAGR